MKNAVKLPWCHVFSICKCKALINNYLPERARVLLDQRSKFQNQSILRNPCPQIQQIRTAVFIAVDRTTRHVQIRQECFSNSDFKTAALKSILHVSLQPDEQVARRPLSILQERIKKWRFVCGSGPLLVDLFENIEVEHLALKAGTPKFFVQNCLIQHLQLAHGETLG